ERHQLVVEWNDTAAAYGGGPCLHDLVAAQAARTPEAPAVRCAAVGGGPEGGSGLTYRQLDEASNRLAHWLRAHGVAAESVVGVLLERSLEMMVALLGVLKAGGAYLPLDPSYPAERLRFFVADAAPALVLSASGLAARVPAGPRLALLDADWPEIAAASAAPPAPAAGPDNLAYVIYTSGSTGRPKGAMNSHRGIVNRILWMQAAYRLDAGDRVLQKTPFSFDVSVWELFWPLALGARLVMAMPGGHRDPAYLVAAIDRERITTLHFVPSMLRAWLDADGVERCVSLRRVMASGEELPADLVARFHALLGGAALHNLYGPTEAAVDVTAWPCPPDPAAARVPIGRPIGNLRTHLLDPGGQLVTAGVAGELHLGGVGVGRGYLRRPELTAARFVPDPFAAEPGGRLYRTGDLATVRPDGAIVFLGRNDHQVKLRGFRIELGEIEAVLRDVPGVADAVALARPRAGGDPALIAYFVAAPGLPPREEELRDALSRQLPDHMVPSAFVLLPALPLTPSGKLDRAALPDPGVGSRPARAIVAPRDEVEMLLVELWEDLLELRPIGVRDDFFALGGHSLLALRLLGGIQRLFGLDLQLATLLEASTVEQIGRLVRAGDRPRRRPLVVPLRAHGSGTPLFCVHPVGGHVLCYLPLARHAALARPVHGIQSPEPSALPAGWSVEAMAETYCAAMREVQPQGPYLLAGWSLGGLVAFEMARQLVAAGSKVALLAMLDVAAPGRRLDAAGDPASELLHFIHDLRGMAGLAPPAGGEPATLPATLDSLLDSEHVRAALPPEVGVGRVRELFSLFSANRRALAAYRPLSYAGRLVLVRAAATAAEEAPGRFHRWRELAAGGAEIHVLAGDHYSLLQPAGVNALAGLLASRIDRALAAGLASAG
ncbi:MAG TPA: amino acid adenylation domain-containing protein, partial [Thermoanaerobaculia bacterium]|nr:amino acid adenylation domain-containing protein [Thermoanaerobaculia bacterium]